MYVFMPLIFSMVYLALLNNAYLVTRYNTVRLTKLKTVSTTQFTTVKTIVYRTATGTYTESKTIPSSSPNSSFQSEILSVHNQLRSNHRVGPLEWDYDLQNSAQEFANNYVCNGHLEHSNLPFGENLALGYNTTSAVSAGYNEIKFYDYGDPTFSQKTGHFTQLVWKNTTKLGCAFVRCGTFYGQYTVCEYDPPGNIVGQFDSNVLPQT